MSKFAPAFAAALIALATAFPAASQEARTTRIEPRPFYGAIVTIEEGVRVFRPLPPTKHVIVNPHGATPLSLSFNETTVRKRAYNYHRHDHRHEGGSGGYGVGGGFPAYGYRGGHRGFGH